MLDVIRFQDRMLCLVWIVSPPGVVRAVVSFADRLSFSIRSCGSGRRRLLLLDFERFFSSTSGNRDLALDVFALVEEGWDILPVAERNEASRIWAPFLHGQPTRCG